ncbi:MAG: ASCH domain-containing protein [bacterium]|nr:ASCH domain-containing protein [bacterium]MDE0417166.1 ASCH domain-containing protein [bacterium]
MIGTKTADVEAFWQSCRKQHGITTDAYHASSFADPGFASYQGELIDLAIAGKKRATAHMALDFERNNIARREIGDYWVVVTPDSEPRCLVRITAVAIKPFNTVDAAFAASEGEGDESLEYWRKVHREYFELQCAHWGVTWREDALTVCESFELIEVA